MARRAQTLSLLLITGIAACLQPPEDSGKLDEDTAGSGGDDSGDDSGDTGAFDPEPLAGNISGTVTVQLYKTGDDGEREETTWDDVGNEFIFGQIYVASYYTDGSVNHYVGSTVISDPSIEGDSYEIEYKTDEPHEAYVYAVLDYYQDTIVGSDEPKGVYPSALEIGDGLDHSDIDITILSPNGYGGGGSCDTATLSGELTITDPWAGGNVMAMVIDTAGAGPYHSSGVLTPTGGSSGASVDYGVTSCSVYGEMKLVGCWDQNGDGMFGPDDRWGAYASEPEVDGNPVNLADGDQDGLTIEIPLGEGSQINIVPFVTLSGTVSVGSGGSFDDLASGTTVHVAALKYRPSGDFEISTAAAYDSDTFEWPNLTGETVKDFSLTVPSNTIVYLWAFADTDADGYVNESTEPVASGGDDGNGRLSTGDAGSSGIGMFLAAFESEE